MSSLIQPFIDDKGIAILDGGLSNQLEVYYKDFAKSRYWTFECLIKKPDFVKQVHLDYLNVGCDIILTSTYSAFIQTLTKDGFSKQKIYDLFKLSVNVAEQAVEQYLTTNQKNNLIKPVIAISLGSYGAYLPGAKEYSGIYDESYDFLIDFHRERLDLAIQLAKNRHIIALETVPNYDETRALVKLLQEYPDIQAWISFTCGNDSQIRDGTPIERVFELTRNVKQVIGVGINCTNPEFIPNLLKKMKECKLNKLLIAYPNTGEEYDAVNKCFIPRENQYNYIDHVKEWQANGLNVIGGCCRITPEDIKKISDQFRKQN